MKKIFTFVAALMVATISFAEVTYEYNGGWANEDGWQNKQDMYSGMNMLWNAFANVPDSLKSEKGGMILNTHKIWLPLDSCAGDVAKGIPAACYAAPYTMTNTFFEAEATKAKFEWLVEYMKYVCTLQKVEANLMDSANSAFLRYNLQAFFLNTQRTAWPVSADYADQGKVDYFQPYWKKGFVTQLL
jgi:hypothetical protein